ncbi:hypothetical protein VmeM32_00053 [Vibrio phage vB_VmeM-32]|nr:hypothetical protein VmeM32_00053 [Vibrio phage vB_VmeM-32]
MEVLIRLVFGAIKGLITFIPLALTLWVFSLILSLSFGLNEFIITAAFCYGFGIGSVVIEYDDDIDD